MAIILTDADGGKQIILEKRARPQGAGESYMIPHERFSLPLSGDMQEWWRGRSSLAHAISRLWHRIFPDLSEDSMYQESTQLSWSWGNRGTQYVIVHMQETITDAVVKHQRVRLASASSLWFSQERMFEKDLISIASAVIGAGGSAQDLCATLNCREPRPAGRVNTHTLVEEDALVTQAAKGQHPVIRLVRDASAAQQALAVIDAYFQSADGTDRVLALDIEGALRVGGWIGLLQVGVGEYAYVFDTIYADAIMALVAPPPSWKASPLAKHLGDETITKIVHSGSGDIMALYAIYGICVRNIFDTCCADTLLRGQRNPRGLGVVLEEWAGVVRPEKKSFVHTDTIWRERPLSWHALTYAAEDVTSLAATYRAMNKVAKQFEIVKCLEHYSMRLPSSTNTKVFILPMCGDRLLIRDRHTDAAALSLFSTQVSDGQLRWPLILDVQKAAMEVWCEVFGEPPNLRSFTPVKCRHVGKCQRVGQFYVLQPAVTWDDDKLLPQGVRPIRLSDYGNGAFEGLPDMEYAAIEWCRYTKARDADLLPALPPSVSLQPTARDVDDDGEGRVVIAAMTRRPSSTPPSIAAAPPSPRPLPLPALQDELLRRLTTWEHKEREHVCADASALMCQCDRSEHHSARLWAGLRKITRGRHDGLRAATLMRNLLSQRALQRVCRQTVSLASREPEAEHKPEPACDADSIAPRILLRVKAWRQAAEQWCRAECGCTQVLVEAGEICAEIRQLVQAIRQAGAMLESFPTSGASAPLHALARAIHHATNSPASWETATRHVIERIQDVELEARRWVGEHDDEVKDVTATRASPTATPAAPQLLVAVDKHEEVDTHIASPMEGVDGYARTADACAAFMTSLTDERPNVPQEEGSHGAGAAEETSALSALGELPAPSISQQGRGEERAGSQQALAALQPRAREATFAATIVRDATQALVMRSYALERQPGDTRTTAAGLVFPRHRMHSGFKGSVIARQAVETVLGPFERVSVGGNDGLQRLTYLGRVGDTMYYEAYVHNLTENKVALFAAWQQRAATPSIANGWIGFELMPLTRLKDKLDRSDDAMAAGKVCGETQPAAEGYGEHMTHGCMQGHPQATATCEQGSQPQPLSGVEGLRLLAVIKASGTDRAPSPTSSSQQGPLAGLTGQVEEHSMLNPDPGLAEQVAEWSELRRQENEDLHARADKLKKLRSAEGGAWAKGESPGEAPPEADAETSMLHAVADAAAKAACKAKLEPPSTAPPDDPTLGNDDDTNVARTRIPGWAPEITRAVLRHEQDADEYISVLKQLAAATGIVERKEAEGTFELVDGILYRIDKSGQQQSPARRQIVVPAQLRGAFMRAYHDRAGHPGVKRVLGLLRERAWWIGMRRDVRAYIRRCPSCAFIKINRIQAGQARSLGNGDHPGDVWTYDILDIDSILRKKYKNKVEASDEPHEASEDVYHPHKLLIFVDRFSRWAEAFPLEKDPTSDEVLEIFVNEIVRRHGFPRAMTCDRGTNLMQGSVREYYDQCGIQLVTNDSYMHNTAGLVERFNGTLKDTLRGYLQDVDEDADVIGARWWRYLTYALLSYNTSEATATGYSPFYLMYGRDARMPLQNTLLPPPTGNAVTYSDFVAEHIKLLYDAWEDARQQAAAAASVSRQQQNLSRDLDFNLKPGDRVLIKKPSHQGLEVPYAGPFRVAQVLGDDRVQLRDLHRLMHDEFHISRLKLYPFVDNDGNVAADGEEYIIKDIKNHRHLDDGIEYFVKWDGFDSDFNRWVHESEFNEHALELVQAYWQRISNGALPSARDGGVTQSTVEDQPFSKASAFKSHRKDHLDAAPKDYVPDEQVAPEVVISRVANAKAKSKGKKGSKKGKQQASDAAAAAAPFPASGATAQQPPTGVEAVSKGLQRFLSKTLDAAPEAPTTATAAASAATNVTNETPQTETTATAVGSTAAPQPAAATAASGAAASSTAFSTSSTSPSTSLPSASTRAARKKQAATTKSDMKIDAHTEQAQTTPPAAAGAGVSSATASTSATSISTTPLASSASSPVALPPRGRGKPPPMTAASSKPTRTKYKT